MKKIVFYWIGLLMSLSLFSQNQYNLIPQPQKITPQNGVFTFKKGMNVSIGNELFEPAAELLMRQANNIGGFGLTVSKGNAANGVSFTLNTSLGKEAYSLRVSSKKIEIQASTGAGAFYAMQTLLQLMPASMSGDQKISSPVTVPNCSIEDAPRFGYRGLMLDVGRYFFKVEDIKRFLDVMAIYKLNTFHWHLTEDQGWRIEIKKYPLLTQISSVRKE